MYLSFVRRKESKPNSKLTLKRRYYRTVYQLGTNRRQKANVFLSSCFVWLLALLWVVTLWLGSKLRRKRNEEMAMPLSAWNESELNSIYTTQGMQRYWGLAVSAPASVSLTLGFCSRAIIDFRVSYQIYLECRTLDDSSDGAVSSPSECALRTSTPKRGRRRIRWFGVIIKGFTLHRDPFDLWYRVVVAVNRQGESVGL